ncbi:MAG: T9SS type A sorting domain-containing protein [bacterium]
MRLFVVTICALLTMISSAHGFQYWNEIRNSALLPGNAVNVRVENLTGAGVENYLLYAASGIQEQVMTAITDGPSTLSATVPGPTTGTDYYGFRLIQGTELDLMPVRVPAGSNPTPTELTRLVEDPVGDELFGYTNLDLTDCRISFSSDRLYAALQNAGGGFPVNQGLTFFGYMVGVADPAVADPDTVWGLLYTFEQAGIISPGLYRIEGTGLGDMTKIGDINVQEYPASNTLVVSCLLSDLSADPSFAAWYDNSDPTLGIAGFTQRITLLGGAAEADRSPGGRCYLREYSIDSNLNLLPTIENGEILGTGSEAYAQIVYNDPDGNSPILSEIVFDGSLSFPLFPLTLDYTGPVTYRTDPGIAPLANESWSTATFRFSDNQTDVVDYDITATGIDDGNRPAAMNRLAISNSPNPFHESTTIRVYIPSATYVTVAIYDVSGALVATVAEGHFGAGYREFEWRLPNTRNTVARSGVFFARVYAGGTVQARKLVLLQ